MNTQQLLTLAARHLAMNWNPQASRFAFKAWAGPAHESTFSVQLGFDAGTTALRCYVHYEADASFVCKSLPVPIDLQDSPADDVPGDDEGNSELRAPQWQQSLLYNAMERMSAAWNPQAHVCTFKAPGAEGQSRLLRVQLAVCPRANNACLMVFDTESGACLAKSASVCLDYQDKADRFDGLRPFPFPEH